jgi:hypothetical protein
MIRAIKPTEDEMRRSIVALAVIAAAGMLATAASAQTF